MNMRELKAAADLLGATIKRYGDEYQVYLNEYRNCSQKMIDKVSYFTDCRKDALKTASQMRGDRSTTFRNGSGQNKKYFEKGLTAKPNQSKKKIASPRSMWPNYPKGLNEKTGTQHNHIISREIRGTK